MPVDPVNYIVLIFMAVLSGAVGYFAVRAICRSELRPIAFNMLRGFIAGAVICGCIGAAIIIGNEFKHGDDLLLVFKTIIVSGSVAAFFGGAGGVAAVRSHLKRETEKGE